MFVGPWERGGEWVDSGINGITRWYNRVWDILEHESEKLKSSNESEGSRMLARKLHQTIRKVYQDLDAFKFNTAIASMMEFTNTLQKVWDEGSASKAVWNECRETFVILMAPIAPHLAEEFWERIGQKTSVHLQKFPSWDDGLVVEEMVTLVVQVDGKVRDKLQVSVDIREAQAKELSLAQENVRRHLQDRDIVKVVYVPGRLVSIVTNRCQALAITMFLA